MTPPSPSSVRVHADADLELIREAQQALACQGADTAALVHRVIDKVGQIGERLSRIEARLDALASALGVTTDPTGEVLR